MLMVHSAFFNFVLFALTARRPPAINQFKIVSLLHLLMSVCLSRVKFTVGGVASTAWLTACSGRACVLMDANISMCRIKCV